MIEKTVLDFLAAALAPVPVRMEIPEEPPEVFVTIEKLGGSKRDHLRHASFALQSWAGSLYDAAALNERVIAAAERLPECGEITGAHLNSDYNFTDTSTKHYRYQAVFDIYHY